MLQAGNTADPVIFAERLVYLSPDEHKEKMMSIAEQLERIGWEKGHIKGWEKGHMKGREEGREEGWMKGREEGREEGWEKGWGKGREEGEAAVLARLLSRRFGPLPEWARERLHRADAAQREAWADAVLDAASLEEVVGAPPDSH
jgi:flagellar biosynthesis/type III secretory pathway protein FliH